MAMEVKTSRTSSGPQDFFHLRTRGSSPATTSKAMATAFPRLPERLSIRSPAATQVKGRQRAARLFSPPRMPEQINRTSATATSPAMIGFLFMVIPPIIVLFNFHLQYNSRIIVCQ